MATELAKAYVQIVPSARGISGKIEEALGGEAEKAGKAGGERFSGAFAKAAKIGAAALGASSTAIADITRRSIAAYADYEQLAGGAKLLFGDAYGTVAKNAQEAFATVQMSQNEYLAQVNGFATGLKTALKGNEGAAAELAHNILKAEADVVAATGQTQEAVQNAFNGVMRGNYTMLDNLQIGITPTKAGYQEVIDKVNAWNKTQGKATKYQMGNLADMEAALVDYVAMVGLSDYAQKEAATTITGSLAMTKAAWSNLLTGAADDTADFNALVSGFADSALKFAGNILPRIGQALSGLGQLAASLAPMLSAALPALISEVLPSLLTAGSTMLTTVISSLAGALPTMIKDVAPTLLAAGWQMLSTVVTGVFDAIPDIYGAAVALVDELAEDISSNLPTLIPSATEAIMTLATELTSPESVETILGAATDIIEALALGILQSIPIVVESAPEIISNLALGIRNALPGIGKAAKEILNTMAESLMASLGDLVSVGENLVKGIWKGISGMGGWLRRKLNEWAESLVGWVKDIFGIASPSKVFASIGGNLTAGLWKGWDKGFPRVMAAIDRDLGGITANAFDLTGSASYTAALAPAGVGYAPAPRDGIVGMVTSIYGMLVEIRNTIPDRLGIDGREVSDVVDRYLGIKAVRKERGN